MKKVLVLIFLILLILSGCNFKNGLESENEPPIEEIEIILYFGDSQAMYVMPEKRLINVEANITKEELAKHVLNELIKGPVDENLYPTIPLGTEVLNLDIESEIVYIDFSKEMKINHWGGAAGENMTMLSLANTMTEIEGIKMVFPSIDGKLMNIEHIIVDEPFERREEGIGSYK